MSRTFWVAIGAIGGVYAYRRGQRAVDNARERGLVGNVHVAAETVGSVAAGAGRLVALAGGQSADPVVVNYRPTAELPSKVRVTPVRRTPLRKQRVKTPATAMRLDALDRQAVIDIRELQRAVG